MTQPDDEQVWEVTLHVKRTSDQPPPGDWAWNDEYGCTAEVAGAMLIHQSAQDNLADVGERLSDIKQQLNGIVADIDANGFDPKHAHLGLEVHGKMRQVQQRLETLEQSDHDVSEQRRVFRDMEKTLAVEVFHIDPSDYKDDES